jgi:hypothetical protein
METSVGKAKLSGQYPLQHDSSWDGNPDTVAFRFMPG